MESDHILHIYIHVFTWPHGIVEPNPSISGSTIYLKFPFTIEYLDLNIDLFNRLIKNKVYTYCDPITLSCCTIQVWTTPLDPVTTAPF